MPTWGVLTTFSFLALTGLFLATKSRLEPIGEPKVIPTACCEPDENSEVFVPEGPPIASANSIFWRETECYSSRLDLGVIFWRPYVDLEDYLYTNDQGNAQIPIFGRNHSLSYSWAWGLKAGYGRKFIYDDWELFLGYTFYQNREQLSTEAFGLTALIPAKGNYLIGQTVDNARSTLRLFWHNLDLNTNKDFHFQDNLLVSTKLGLRNSWLGLKQNTTYVGGALLDANHSCVEQKSDFWGIGPMVGFGSRWLFCNAFYLRGGFAGALQYGINRIHFHETVSNLSSQEILIRESLDYIAPNVDFDLGIGIADYFLDKTLFLSLDLCYENHYFWRQNQMPSLKPYTTATSVSAPRFESLASDAAFQGFTLRLSFRY